MAFESDLIRRYSGAFSKDDCDKIIKGIKFFEDNHLLFYDRTYLTSEDHKVVNVSHDYDFSASSRIGNEILPKVKPCVDEYLQAFAVLNKKKFLLHDIKLKHIPAGGGFHTWHYETGALEVAARQFVIQVYFWNETEVEHYWDLIDSTEVELDQKFIDFNFHTHLRHQGNKEHAKNYLQWETDLIKNMNEEERRFFR